MLIATTSFLIWEHLPCVIALITVNPSVNYRTRSTASAFLPRSGTSTVGACSIVRPSPLFAADFFDEILDDEEDQTDDDFDFDESMVVTPFDEYTPKLNIVTLSGRIGQAPEPRYFDDGKVVLNLSMAVKRKYHPLERTARGITEDVTDWFRLELWGRDAEYAAKYVTKGCRVGITGSLVVDDWRDRATGEERTAAKILCRHLDILETKAESEARLGRTNTNTNYDNNYNSGGGAGGNYNGNYNTNDDTNDTKSAGSGGFFD